jgi:hypothetical protein
MNLEIVPCTCTGWETGNCTKLCECAPEYPTAVAELEYASWFPVAHVSDGVAASDKPVTGD